MVQADDKMTERSNVTAVKAQPKANADRADATRGVLVAALQVMQQSMQCSSRYTHDELQLHRMQVHVLQPAAARSHTQDM